MIIGLSGKKGAGKDTVGAFIREATATLGWNGQEHDLTDRAKCLALADPIKQIAVDYFGVTKEDAWGSQDTKENTLVNWRWDEIPSDKRKNTIKVVGGVRVNLNPLMTVRELLQWIGTELFRETMHTDFWVKATLNLIRGKHKHFAHHVITDVRFPNEVQGVSAESGINIRIVRPGLNSTDTHASETSLDSEDQKWIKSIGYSEADDRAGWKQAPNECSFDIILFNNGNLDDLKRVVKDIVDFIGLNQKILQ
jgi:hypothetical protein